MFSGYNAIDFVLYLGHYRAVQWEVRDGPIKVVVASAEKGQVLWGNYSPLCLEEGSSKAIKTAKGRGDSVGSTR